MDLSEKLWGSAPQQQVNAGCYALKEKETSFILTQPFGLLETDIAIDSRVELFPFSIE